MRQKWQIELSVFFLVAILMIGSVGALAAHVCCEHCTDLVECTSMSESYGCGCGGCEMIHSSAHEEADHTEKSDCGCRRDLEWVGGERESDPMQDSRIQTWPIPLVRILLLSLSVIPTPEKCDYALHTLPPRVEEGRSVLLRGSVLLI